MKVNRHALLLAMFATGTMFARAPTPPVAVDATFGVASQALASARLAQFYGRINF